MKKIRLIDSDAEVYGYVETWICDCSEFGRQSVMAVEDISYLPEIDPETLPIVRELQDKLKHVITERDEARRDCAVAESNHSECLAQLAKARVQLKSAITDMEALMWHSEDGCNICSHCVEVHREPYVRLDCGLGGSCECKPEWRGVAP